MRVLGRAAIFVSAFVGCAAAALAQARPARVFEPVGGARLQAGEIARVSWTSVVPAGREFDETELVLSLDGGRTAGFGGVRAVSRPVRRAGDRRPTRNDRTLPPTGLRRALDPPASISAPSFPRSLRRKTKEDPCVSRTFPFFYSLWDSCESR